ncbi:MAG: T9SS type A sorting domain-containing protein [Ignavibacteria bacterium]
MKNLIILISVLLLFISQSLYSQSGWIQQSGGISVTLNSTYFINPYTGWICGDSGKIIKTTNAGSNWIPEISNTIYPLISVFFINENTGWCAGGTADFNMFVNRMFVLKTTNSGLTWTTAFYSNSSYSRFGPIFFTDDMHGYVVEQGGTGSGTVGGLWKSSNGGFDWMPVQGVSATQDLQFTDLNTGWTIGSYFDDTGHDTSYIFRTIDGGAAWDKIFQKSKTVLLSSSFLNNSTGWISGVDNENFLNANLLLKTTNGGMNFTRHDLEIGMYFRSITFKNNMQGWACGNNVYRTTDGGNNWVMQLSNSGSFYNSIFFVDSLNGWVVGYDGVIFSTRTGGITAVNNYSVNSPTDFILDQNYPNPFNPKTIINYELPSNVNGQRADVKLIVYDLLGKEIVTLVDAKQNPGSYSIDFDGSNLPSGIYLYKLTTGEYIEVRKMTLLK